MVFEAAYEGSLHGNTVQHSIFEVRKNTVQHGVLVTTTEHCPYCGSGVQQGDTTCTNCGANIESMWANLPDGFILIDDTQRRLEIKRVLGRGGFGITYLVKPVKKGGRRVTVKELFPDGLVVRDANGTVRAKQGNEKAFESSKMRFLAEAQILRKLKHPSSTAFKGIWPMNGTLYMTLEFIDGETLEAHIARGAHLSESEAIAILHPVLEALEELHGYGLLHRDIKPANLMLPTDPDRPVELIDFGSAVAFQAGAPTKLTSAILTPQYAPLELYGSNVRLGPPSDLYSLGATIYEAVSGVRIPTALERANGAVVQPLEATVSTVSREFSKLVARTLELRVDDRFQTALEMRAALERLPLFSSTQSAPTAQVGAPFVPTTSSTPTPQNPVKARKPLIGPFNTPVSSAMNWDMWFVMWSLILAGIGIPVGVFAGWWALFAPIIVGFLVLVGNVFLLPGFGLLLVVRYKGSYPASPPQTGVYGWVSLVLALVAAFIPTYLATDLILDNLGTNGGRVLYGALALVALTLISSQAIRWAANLPFRGVRVPNPALVGFGLAVLVTVIGPSVAVGAINSISSLLGERTITATPSTTPNTTTTATTPSSPTKSNPVKRIQVTGWVVPERAWNNQFSSVAVFRALDENGAKISGSSFAEVQVNDLRGQSVNRGDRQWLESEQVGWKDSLDINGWTGELLAFKGKVADQRVQGTLTARGSKDSALEIVKAVNVSLSADRSNVIVSWKPVPNAKRYEVAAPCCGILENTRPNVEFPLEKLGSYGLWLTIRALGFDDDDILHSDEAALSRGSSFISTKKFTLADVKRLKPGASINITQWTK